MFNSDRTMTSAVTDPSVYGVIRHRSDRLSDLIAKTGKVYCRIIRAEDSSLFSFSVCAPVLVSIFLQTDNEQILGISHARELCELISTHVAELNHVNIATSFRKLLQFSSEELQGNVEECVLQKMLNFGSQEISNILHILAKELQVRKQNKQQRSLS